MTGPDLLQVLKAVVSTARRHRVRVILMGGMAVSVYAPPRATYDIDAIGEFGEGTMAPFLADLKKQGFTFDEGKPVREIAGLPFVSFFHPRSKIYFDLFIAESEFQESIVRRSRPLRFEGIELELISPEDLILVKILSGRSRDNEDIRQILEENSRTLDFDYLREWAGKLGRQVFLEDEIKSVGINLPDLK